MRCILGKNIYALMLAVVAMAPWCICEASALDLPSQPLSSALRTLGDQTKINVLFAQDSVEGRVAPAITGARDIQDALAKLLVGTGLTYRFINADTVTLIRVSEAARGQSWGNVDDPMQRVRLASQSEPNETERPENPASPKKSDAGMGEIAVTGTRIRGAVSVPSPVIRIDAERIREEGFTDIGEVIRSIPQNFNGGQNPGVVNGQAGNIANLNISGGSSLNLRGLGPDATLTLLNGRRMSYGGLYQSVDVGAIPLEAVQRIEIVADGASAIYGSDAVGGVGNVILKRSFDGIALGARYGAATEGGMTSREYTATAGMNWSGGGVIATYKGGKVDPILSNRRDYTRFLANPTTIYPGSELSSGLISAFHGFGEVAEVRLDAFRTDRDQRAFVGRPTFFALNTPATSVSMVSPSVEFSLWRGWTLSAGGSFGEDETVSNTLNTTLPAGVTTLSSNVSYRNRNRTYDLGAEGSLFSLRGNDVRLAVGAGYRMNEYRQLNKLTQVSSSVGDESSRFAYAEVNVPLLRPAAGATGTNRLALTAAIRGEDYDSFGRVNTPKLGLVYGPSESVTLKASWGRSFKAPTLTQRFGPQFVYLDPISSYGVSGYPAASTVVVSSGSNPAIGPERARTWTASLMFHPQALPGLETEFSVFNIDYTNRVVNPIVFFNQALANPVYAAFVTYAPTAQQLAAVVSNPAAQFINLAGVPYNASNVVAMVDTRNANANKQRIRGIDLSGGYGFDLEGSRLTLRGSASWLDSSQKTNADFSLYDLSGTLYNPAKIKGRIGLVWSRGGLMASGFGNYTGGVNDTVNRQKTGSFTTVDATLRYATDERGGLWSNVDLSLSGQNLLNRMPPSFTSASLISVHYDSTNYSAIGRFISASISKRW